MGIIPGYESEPAEVEALAEQILDDIREGLADVTDPLELYSRLCAEQVRQVAVSRAVIAGIMRMRGVALRRMADDGATYDQIATAAGLGNRQRVSQLIAPAEEKACPVGVHPGH